jgi:hypothetical protein
MWHLRRRRRAGTNKQGAVGTYTDATPDHLGVPGRDMTTRLHPVAVDHGAGRVARTRGGFPPCQRISWSRAFNTRWRRVISG